MNHGTALLLAVAAGAALALAAPRARAAIAPSPAADRMSSPPSVPWMPPSSAAPYLDAIGLAEATYGLPSGLLVRVLYQESHYRADIVSGATVSSAGAVGIAQFMPDTAAQYGVNPYDAESSIDGAARYLADLYARFGDWSLALIAYNWGPGNLARKGVGAAPAESRAYATQILVDVPA